MVMSLHPYPVPDSKKTALVFLEGSWADWQDDIPQK
jgi:hypothetical protein